MAVFDACHSIKPDPVSNIEATMIKTIDFISHAEVVVCEVSLGDM